MKVCIIQPAYSTEYSRSDELFAEELRLLDACDASMDLIVLPEYCDIPCLASTREEADASSARYRAPLLARCAEVSRRCGAMLFVNARSASEEGYRNTTYAFDRRGEIVGRYYKQHPTHGEEARMRLDCEYSYEFSEPTVIEMEGIRFAFLTCYDFYFYESYASIARQNVDIVIGCSHQRTDTHTALEVMSQHLAYNTNAYVVRSSVSMGEDSEVGGASMVVAPTGKILAHMGSRVGLEAVEIDPHLKYRKPAGFGNPPSAHYEYIEKGRRPWKYRPAGSAVVRHDAVMPYPRVCAHRGFNTIAPENSMPAFGAAVAMGAEEIEFDLWFTRDGELVALHDPTLDRVSDGTGKVWEHTLAELRTLDFGAKHAAPFRGLRIPTFEDILKKLACHCVMNIHLKTSGGKQLHKVIDLIRKYDCEKYVYLTSGDDAILARLQEEYPEIPRCCGGGSDRFGIVERAIRYECQKLQLFKPYFTQEMIDRAHAHGIVCNVFCSDDPEETERFLDMGIDVILTNDYQRIADVVSRRQKYRMPEA